jgi:hypothetical protein
MCQPRRINHIHGIAAAEGEGGHAVELAEDAATEVHVGGCKLTSFGQINAVAEVVEPAVFIPLAALEEVAVLDGCEGVRAGLADPSEGVIIVLVDDGSILLHDAQHGADVVGEIIIEGGRVVHGLGETDQAVHAGQEPVDAGAVHVAVVIGVLVLGADVRAVVDVAGDIGFAPYCLAGQDAS